MCKRENGLEVSRKEGKEEKYEREGVCVCVREREREREKERVCIRERME